MIHPSSIIAPGAQIAENVEIGPLCYVGPNVKIGPGCRLISHCNIDGHTTIGSNNVFHPFSAIGQPAQDHGVVPGSVSYVEIGNDNIFRENTTVHSGTKPETVTKIGNHCMFMAGSHIAHNCKVGNNVIIVNASVLGGYAEVADNALISGLCAVHQFCRVGRFAMISGVSAMSKDVPPFMTAEGRNGGVKMVNLVGLKRAGFSDETIVDATGYADTTNQEILDARKLFAERMAHHKAIISQEAEKVRETGGLFIIGTERHESRRIDNQARFKTPPLCRLLWLLSCSETRK